MLLWLGLLVSAVFTYLAVRGVDFAGVHEALGESHYWWLAPALGALAIGTAGRALRWQLLFRRETRPPLPRRCRRLVGRHLRQQHPARPRRRGCTRRRAEPTEGHARRGCRDRGDRAALDVLCLLLLLLQSLRGCRRCRGCCPRSFSRSPSLLVSRSLPGCSRARRPAGPCGAAPAGTHSFRRLDARRASRRQPRAGFRRAARLAPLAAALGLTTFSWLWLGLSMWFVLRALQLGLSP